MRSNCRSRLPAQQAKDPVKDQVALAHARVLALLSLAANDTAASGRAAAVARMRRTAWRVSKPPGRAARGRPICRRRRRKR